MVTGYTADQIRSWPVDADGWHVDPETGTHIRIGEGARVGDRASVGDYASVGDGASVGDDNPVLSLRIQFDITIYRHEGEMVAQIGCEYRTIKDWLKVTGAEAAGLGLDPQYYKQIRALLRKLAK